MIRHVMRVRFRQDDQGETFLYTGECECGFGCKFWSSERKHVEDVLYEHAMNVADSQDKKAGFAA